MNTIKQLCTFYLDQTLFGVDVTKVQEVIRLQEMTPVPLSSSSITGLINLRGQIVTAIALREQLGFGPAMGNNPLMNVVVHSDGGAVSLLVDKVGDVLEVDPSTYENVPSQLQPPMGDVVPGVFKLDKELLLLLDAERVVSRAALEQQASRSLTQ